MSAVQDTVFGIIAKEAGIDIATIKPDSTLKDLNIQSLDAVQIIFEIEDHYKITLPDRDPNFDTESVKGLIDAVEKLVAEKEISGGARPSPHTAPAVSTTDSLIQQAADSAYDFLDALCHPYIASGKLVGIIKSDPYVAGFLGARITGICAATSHERGLTGAAAEQVLSVVLLKLYGSEGTYKDIEANESKLRGDAQFELGYARGEKFLAYITHEQDIKNDPDYAKAMDIVRSSSIPEKDGIFTALTGLDRIWFGSYMEKYL